MKLYVMLSKFMFMFVIFIMNFYPLRCLHVCWLIHGFNQLTFCPATNPFYDKSLNLWPNLKASYEIYCVFFCVELEVFYVICKFYKCSILYCYCFPVQNSKEYASTVQKVKFN